MIKSLVHRQDKTLKWGRKGSPHFRPIRLSLDADAIVTHYTETKIPFKNVKEIKFGQTTASFKRVPKPKLENLSFSVLYLQDDGEERSLDMAANSEEDFKLWTTVLPVLINRAKGLADNGSGKMAWA
jgi:hypothetical protein